MGQCTSNLVLVWNVEEICQRSNILFKAIMTTVRSRKWTNLWYKRTLSTPSPEEWRYARSEPWSCAQNNFSIWSWRRYPISFYDCFCSCYYLSQPGLMLEFPLNQISGVLWLSATTVYMWIGSFMSQQLMVGVGWDRNQCKTRSSEDLVYTCISVKHIHTVRGWI